MDPMERAAAMVAWRRALLAERAELQAESANGGAR